MSLPPDLQIICPTLIGRAAALSTLVRAIASVEAGSGQTLVIAGEAGTGKSRLLSEGNPFFVEEILKSLVTTGGIFFAHGPWDRKPLSELAIPRSAAVAVQQRLAHLSAGARRLLTVASVAGRRFDLALLQQVLASPAAASPGDDEQMLRLIKELAAAQLVRSFPPAAAQPCVQSPRRRKLDRSLKISTIRKLNTVLTDSVQSVM